MAAKVAKKNKKAQMQKNKEAEGVGHKGEVTHDENVDTKEVSKEQETAVLSAEELSKK